MTQRHLFDLPPELRQIIFEYALTSAKGFIWKPTGSKASLVDTHRTHPKSMKGLALLATCKSVNAECHMLLYKMNILKIRQPNATVPAMHGVDLQSTRHFRQIWVNLRWSPHWRREWLFQLLRSLQQLVKNGNLKRVTLAFSKPFDHSGSVFYYCFLDAMKIAGKLDPSSVLSGIQFRIEIYDKRSNELRAFGHNMLTAIFKKLSSVLQGEVWVTESERPDRLEGKPFRLLYKPEIARSARRWN